MSRPVRCLLALLLLFPLAGCADRREEDGRGDDGRGEVPEVPVQAIDEDGQVMLSPAESAAAVRAVEAHSRAVRDSVARASAIEGLEAPAPPAAPAEPAPRTYAECRSQAERAATEDEREVLLGVCRRLPGAP